MGIFEKDSIWDEKKQKEVHEAYKNLKSTTYEERLRLFFRTDAYGNLSPELQDVNSSTGIAVMAGAGYALITSSKSVYAKFIEDNKHEMFASPKEAQNELRREMMKHCSGATIRLGAKMGIIVGSYTLATSLVNSYQNDITIHGHAACGFVLGSCYNLLQGPRAMLASGIIGAFLGMNEGLCQRLSLWIGDTSYSDLMYRRLQEMEIENKSRMNEQRNQVKTIKDSWQIEDQAMKDESMLGPVTNAVTRFLRELLYGK